MSGTVSPCFGIVFRVLIFNRSQSTLQPSWARKSVVSRNKQILRRKGKRIQVARLCALSVPRHAWKPGARVWYALYCHRNFAQAPFMLPPGSRDEISPSDLGSQRGAHGFIPQSLAILNTLQRAKGEEAGIFRNQLTLGHQTGSNWEELLFAYFLCSNKLSLNTVRTVQIWGARQKNLGDDPSDSVLVMGAGPLM